MSLRRMRHYIDVSLAAFGDSLGVVVFTGGECFLLGLRLRLAVAYASRRGLATRVVTNGYWATSERRAKRMLRALQRCGLREVNFSTGAAHRRWVPRERVINGCVAAVRLGITCVVNVEQHGADDEGYQQFIAEERIVGIIKQRDAGELKSLFMVIAGVWMEPDAARQGDKSERTVLLANAHGCDTLFGALMFAPTGDLYACCGLTVRNNPHLKVRLSRYPAADELRAAWGRLAEDFLLLWIYAEGPVAIHRMALAGMGESMRLWEKHSCEVCIQLFNRDSLQRLREVYEPHRARVFELCRLRQQALESNVGMSLNRMNRSKNEKV